MSELLDLLMGAGLLCCVAALAATVAGMMASSRETGFRGAERLALLAAGVLMEGGLLCLGALLLVRMFG